MKYFCNFCEFIEFITVSFESRLKQNLQNESYNKSEKLEQDERQGAGDGAGRNKKLLACPGKQMRNQNVSSFYSTFS